MRVENTRASNARRTGFGCGTAIVTGIIVLFTVSVISLSLFLVSRGGGSSALLIHGQPGSVRWDGRHRLTVLLTGISRRSGGPARAEALAIVSYNPIDRTLHMLSLPSDLWVTIPGFGPGRLSEAYGDGGMGLTVRVVQSVTHIPVAYFAAVDSAGFRQIVDALGGLTLGVSSVVDVGTRSARVARLDRALSVGHPLHLNGTTALAWMRVGEKRAPGIRIQMRRQQQVLFALRKQAGQSQAFFRIPTIVNALGGAVITDFPYDQVPALAHTLISVSDSRVEGVTLSPSNNAAADYVQNGHAVLLPDLQRIAALARHTFPDPQLGSVPVRVLNGSGIDGEAAGLSGWLQQSGIRVSSFGSAPQDAGRTEVYLPKGADAPTRYVAESVGALLRAPSVTRPVRKGNAPVTVIIGHDFQDPTQQ